MPLALLGASACSSNGAGTSATASPTSAGAAATPGSASGASAVLPDLSSLGFESSTQTQPLIQCDAGGAVELYEQPASGVQARVDVGLCKTTQEAVLTFGKAASALAHLPPNLFGITATQKTAAPTGVGPDDKAYVTAQPDPAGHYVWTDVYHFGRVVAVVFVIDKNASNALTIRKAIAQRIKANAPS